MHYLAENGVHGGFIEQGCIVFVCVLWQSACLLLPHELCLVFALTMCLSNPWLQGLAKSIAWDGEGATCLMEIEVVGANNEDDARIIARSVAGSSLAKVQQLHVCCEYYRCFYPAAVTHGSMIGFAINDSSVPISAADSCDMSISIPTVRLGSISTLN